MSVNEKIELLINLSFKDFSSNKKMKSNQVKCSRDLRYILEAVFKDIENDTTIFTNRVANKFWYDGKRQLKSHDIEIKVYNFLSKRLKKMLTTDEYEKATRSIDLLIQIVSTGPKMSDLGTKLVYDSLKAEHCQRNWDLNYYIPDNDLDVLVKVATTMPTKQNRDYYKLIVSTDREFNKIAHSLSMDPSNPHTPRRNSQVNANVLFIYAKNLNFENTKNKFVDNHDNNTSMAVGISSGALAFAATQLDYRVGFCQCYLQDRLKEELLKKNIILDNDEDIKLLVGIGKPMSNYNWNQVIINNKVVENIIPCVKNIKVFKI